MIKIYCAIVKIGNTKTSHMSAFPFDLVKKVFDAHIFASSKDFSHRYNPDESNFAFGESTIANSNVIKDIAESGILPDTIKAEFTSDSKTHDSLLKTLAEHADLKDILSSEFLNSISPSVKQAVEIELYSNSVTTDENESGYAPITLDGKRKELDKLFDQALK